MTRDKSPEFDVSDATPVSVDESEDVTPPIHDLSQADLQWILAKQRALIEDLRTAAVELARDRGDARELLTETLLTLANERGHADLVLRISTLLRRLKQP